MAAPGAGGFVIEEPGSPSPDYAAKVSAAREQRLADDLEAVRLSSERARQAERERRAKLRRDADQLAKSIQISTTSMIHGRKYRKFNHK